MHGIEDVLVHHTDVHGNGTGEDVKVCRKIGHRSLHTVYLHQHHHDEHILKDGLGHVNNITISVGAYVCNFCKNTYRVLTDYGNYSFHGIYLFRFFYILSQSDPVYKR